MKKRYWVTALSLFALAALVGLTASPYRFSSGFLAALGVVCLALGLLNACKRKIFHTIFCIVVLVGVVGMIATGVWIGANMGGTEEMDAQFVIVLGAGVNGSEPSQSLAERLEAVMDYLDAHPDAVLILSGGQGDEENISEAQCMYDYLTSHGVSASRLRLEREASTTEENLEFSLRLIEAETGKEVERVGIISSEYHLLRASLIADDLGVEAECYPAETQNKLYFCNMLLREIFAVWFTLFT